jgi:hypothetical protein
MNVKSERAVRLALKRWEHRRGKAVAVPWSSYWERKAWQDCLAWVLGYGKDPTTKHYHTKQRDETVHKK